MKEAISTERRNAIFNVAKECDQELKTAVKQNPKTPFNDISEPILKKHHERIKALCSLPCLAHAVGVLNGRFNDYR